MILQLENLTDLFCVSGREEQIRFYICEQLKPFCDRVFVDNIGNLIAVKEGKSSDKKVMISTNLDTYGLMVTSIVENEKVLVSAIGDFDLDLLRDSKVIFENGLSGSVVISENKPVENIKEIYVIPESFEGIRVGEFCMLKPKHSKLDNKNYLVTRQGNKTNISVLMSLIKSMVKPLYDTYFVFSCYSIISSIGIHFATKNIEPDCALITDYRVIKPIEKKDLKETDMSLKPILLHKDESFIASKSIVERIVSLSEESGINITHEVLAKGKSAGFVVKNENGGCLTGHLTLPLSKSGETDEILDVEVLENFKQLLTLFIESEFLL